MMNKSMMLTICDTLKAAGIDAYLPGKHEGVCLTPYAVIEDGGIAQTGKTTGRHVYVVTACVPMEAPSTVANLIARIRAAMRSIKALKVSANQSPDLIDEETRAYCVEMEYSALCSLI